jgi:opacity protein-like surface antigen
MLRLVPCKKPRPFFTLFTIVLVWLLTSPALSGAEGPCAPGDEGGGKFNLGTRDDLAAVTFENETSVTPYIGAGIGKAGQVNDVHENFYKQPSEAGQEAPDYKIGFGVDCYLSENTGLTLGYQWNAGSAPELLEDGVGSLSPEQENHYISIGIKVDF